jgi:hypothetical protein
LSTLFAVSGSAQTPVAKISGDVVRVDGQNLELRAKDGERLRIELSDHVRLSARSPVGVDAIKQQAYVGATAVPQADGTLLASEVHIFPESMRGTAEGHRLLPPEAGKDQTSNMTNATVTGVTGGKSASTMTNAVVSKVSPAENALTMTLAYPGGEKTVVVPQGALIMKTEKTVDRSALVPGAHVVAYAIKQPDGTLLSEHVNVRQGRLRAARLSGGARERRERAQVGDLCERRTALDQRRHYACRRGAASASVLRARTGT